MNDKKLLVIGVYGVKGVRLLEPRHVMSIVLLYVSQDENLS